MSQTLIIFLTIVGTLLVVAIIYSIFMIRSLIASIEAIWDALDKQNDTTAMMQNTQSVFEHRLKMSSFGGGIAGMQVIKMPFPVDKMSMEDRQNDREQTDEHGHTREWYIEQLNSMKAKFDGDETLAELGLIYRLLE